MITALHPTLQGRLIQIGIHIHIKPTAIVDYSGGLEIHEYCSISDNVIIYTHRHHYKKRFWQELPDSETLEATPLLIEDHVFIGAGAIILGGVGRIGKCAVIGAGSVVTKLVPDFEIWAGNPAKKIGDVK